MVLELSPISKIKWDEAKRKKFYQCDHPILNKRNNIVKDAYKNKSIGFVAQEVEVQFPELVHTDDEGYKSLNYSLMVITGIGSLQEQNDKIEKIKNKMTRGKKYFRDLNPDSIILLAPSVFSIINIKEKIKTPAKPMYISPSQALVM